MKLNPYLTFDGNGLEAAQYYVDSLDGELLMSMTFGQMPDSPDWVTDANRDRLAHASIKIGETVVMISDTAGQDPFTGYAGFTLQLSANTVEEGQSLFDTLAADGSVRMPYGETFWAKGFGMLTDKFGVPWMINCD